jgi:hypothetical protein
MTKTAFSFARTVAICRDLLAVMRAGLGRGRKIMAVI